MASPLVDANPAPAVVITEEQARQRLTTIARATAIVEKGSEFARKILPATANVSAIIEKGGRFAGKIEDVLMILRAHPTLASERFHVWLHDWGCDLRPLPMTYLSILVCVTQDEDNIMITRAMIEEIYSLCPASLQFKVTKYSDSLPLHFAVNYRSNINDGIVEFLATQDPDAIEEISLESFFRKHPKPSLKLIRVLFGLCPDFEECNHFYLKGSIKTRMEWYADALKIAMKNECPSETLFYIVGLLSGEKLSYLCLDRKDFNFAPYNAMIVATLLKRVDIQILNIDFNDDTNDWDRDLESVGLILNALPGRQSVTDLRLFLPKHTITQTQYSRLAESLQQALDKNEAIQSLKMDGGFDFPSGKIDYEATKEDLVVTEPVLQALLNSRSYMPRKLSLREFYLQDLSSINCIICSKSSLVEVKLYHICLSGKSNWKQSLLSGTSNIRKLQVLYCPIKQKCHVDSYFNEFMDLVNTLPKLKTLQLLHPFIFDDGSFKSSASGQNQVMKLASLVRRNVIEELEYKNEIDDRLVMDEMFDAMSTNTSLKTFHFMESLSNEANHRKMVSVLTNQNKTLESITTPTRAKQVDIGFFTYLNVFGRKTVSSGGVAGFVKLVETVNASDILYDVSEDSVEMYCDDEGSSHVKEWIGFTSRECVDSFCRSHQHVTFSRLNILYGLLQEDPSVWTGI